MMSFDAVVIKERMSDCLDLGLKLLEFVIAFLLFLLALLHIILINKCKYASLGYIPIKIHCLLGYNAENEVLKDFCMSQVFL